MRAPEHLDGRTAGQANLVGEVGVDVSHEVLADQPARASHEDAATTVGHRRLNHLRSSLLEILACGVRGDVVEVGFGRDGATRSVRAVLDAYRGTERTVWVIDSLYGLPAAAAEDRSAEFERLLNAYGMVGGRVAVLQRWDAGPPSSSIGEISLLRVRGDDYDATTAVLEALYPRLQPGGICVIDGCARASCRAAVDDFRQRHAIRAELEHVDWTAVAWSKHGAPASVGLPVVDERREAAAYLELLKRSLLRAADDDRFLSRAGDPRLVLAGKDSNAPGETMVGRARLDNLQACIAVAVADGVPGDILEAGVWRGGASILARGTLAALGVTDRLVWVADSFVGLPFPDPERWPADREDFHHAIEHLRVSRLAVESAFERYGLLDGHVRFLEGWFSETLPNAPIERLAVLRLDGDMYGSTMETLEALYDKLSPGGFCLIDDFELRRCRAAVEDFRARRGIDDPIEIVDWTGVYWRKSR